MNKARLILATGATAAMLAFMTLTSSVLAAQPNETVRIAVIETLSSPSAVIGKWWANHVQYAVDRINAKGGVLGGRKIEIVYSTARAVRRKA